MCLVAAVALTAAPDKKPAKPAKSSPQASMTGCLDQRGESYVLGDEKDMSKKTTLKAKGFSDDNFARYVGHKVLVRGTSSGDVFEVVKIEDVAESCSSK